MKYRPPFRPVGFNLGGWISQSTLTDGHVKDFIREEDFKTIAGWGFNSVRLPLDAPWLFQKGGKGPASREKLNLLRVFLGWAQRAGLLVILDLHQVPWHSFAKPELENLWKNADDLRSFCSLWEELASELRDFGDGLWFELLNEPTARDPRDWNRVAEQSMEAIRKSDPRRQDSNYQPRRH